MHANSSSFPHFSSPHPNSMLLTSALLICTLAATATAQSSMRFNGASYASIALVGCVLMLINCQLILLTRYSSSSPRHTEWRRVQHRALVLLPRRTAQRHHVPHKQCGHKRVLDRLYHGRAGRRCPVLPPFARRSAPCVQPRIQSCRPAVALVIDYKGDEQQVGRLVDFGDLSLTYLHTKQRGESRRRPVQL